MSLSVSQNKSLKSKAPLNLLLVKEQIKSFCVRFYLVIAFSCLTDVTQGNLFHKTEKQTESVDESVILVWKEGKNGFIRRVCNAREGNLNFLHLWVIC